MTIISHRHKYIFLKTRKTAGSSIELWLCKHLGPRDLIRGGEEITELHPELAVPEREQLRRLSREWQALRNRPTCLAQHMSAKRVREFVGDRRWRNYTKFTVERDPWDRTISLWRWRMHRRQLSLSLDDFLSALECRDKDKIKQAGAYSWSKWGYYTIENKLAVDHVIPYENLNGGLGEIFVHLGLPWDGQLPYAKSGIRGAKFSVSNLSESQIERIGRIFRREIALFGYRAPVAVSAIENLA